MKNKIIMNCGEASFDSSFLIPSGLMPVFEAQVNKFGGIREMFQFVANSKHEVYNDRPRTSTGRTTYSPKGMNLQKVNFKPNNEDWERFRLIAQSQRISMCLLFVMVLLFWDRFETDGLGVPAIPGKFALLISLTVGPLYTRIQLCRHRI